jgi:hypothetical protein
MEREVCVISMRAVTTPLLRPWRWHFTADRIGGGPWAILAESLTFTARTKVTKRTLNSVACVEPSASGEALAALSALMQQLADDGWEQVMDDEPVIRPWYYRRLRRMK